MIYDNSTIGPEVHGDDSELGPCTLPQNHHCAAATSETPETDNNAGYEDGSGCWKSRINGKFVYADFARDLERRLREAEAKNDDRFQEGFATGTILMASLRQFNRELIETLAMHNHNVWAYRARAEAAKGQGMTMTDRELLDGAAKARSIYLDGDGNDRITPAAINHIGVLGKCK